jgi:lipase maturation factor 1
VSAVERPLLIYDAECRFCRRWIARWRARTGGRITYLPLQQPGLLRRLGVPLSDALRSIQLVTPDGKRYEGADAVFRALGHTPGLWLLTRLARLPLARWIAEWLYRRIARHRGLAARVDTVLFGRSTSPPGTALVRSLFMRALGGVYLIAFTSLRRQVLGLYGEHGIEPIRDYLDAVRAVTSPRAHIWRARAASPPPRGLPKSPRLERARRVPTLFWLDASDATLVRACVAGQVCSGLLMAGIAPRLTSAALWTLYLSFVSAGRDFLGFQWDALLLETGLAAVIVAPPGRRDRALARRRTSAGTHASAHAMAPVESPPWTAVALMRWLVFRLYFESGLAKLASGDPTWRDLSACCYHYTTQPLPTRLGWHAHQLPRRFQRLSTFVVLALELGAPFFVFAPRRIRRAALAALAGLQALIAATGNYGFFNLLTVVNSLWMLDDEPVARTLGLRTPPAQRTPWWRRVAVAIMVLPLMALSVSELLGRLRRGAPGPRDARGWGATMRRALARLHGVVAPFHAVNPYGLFAAMTTERPEIVIEGSMDGIEWREYHFRYKPGDVRRPPRRVAPHQPRLDWQMWFAALQPPPVWFGNFLVRLLEGAPDVVGLLDGNPFPDAPPTYVRALLYDYRMTDRQTRRRTGAWWHRELRGLYVPPVRLADPAIRIRS